MSRFEAIGQLNMSRVGAETCKTFNCLGALKWNLSEIITVGENDSEQIMSYGYYTKGHPWSLRQENWRNISCSYAKGVGVISNICATKQLT